MQTPDLPSFDDVCAELGRRSLSRFIDQIDPELTRVVFHDAIDQELTRWAEDGGFLIIVSPPRVGKSERISRKLPAYLLARDPTCEIIATAYGADLANSFSQDVRRLVQSTQYNRWYPDTKIARGENKVDRWRTTAGGGYRAAGITGGVTGMGANWLLIDDPFKNREEADSPARRRKVWSEYTSTFRSRLEPDRRGKFGVLLTLTRWHHDDLAGRLLDLASKDPDADPFVHYRFPALAEPDAGDRHPLDTRAEGEPLWPDKYGVKALKALRANSERDWVSLYQGRPNQESGDIFKRHWFRFYHEPCAPAYAPPQHVVVDPEGNDVHCAQRPKPSSFRKITVSVDASFKGVAGSDYCGVGVWGEQDGDHYLLDLIEERLAYPDLKKRLTELIDVWRPGRVLIEDAANGPAVISELRQAYGEGLIVPCPTRGGKVARAHATTPLPSQGRVYLPHPTQSTWVLDFIERLCQFPNVGFDDIVDQATHYLAWYQSEHGTDGGWLEALAT